MEPAQYAAKPPPPVWTSYVPLIMVALVGAGVIIWLAPRKGQSRLLAWLMLLPCFGPLVVLYLLSLTDKRVLDDIEALKKQVGADKDDSQAER